MRPLPRDTRDTLFLLAVIAAAVLPHASHLPLWCSVVTALVLGWRGLLAWRGAPLPGRWTLLTVLALVLGLTLMTHRSLLGREPGITMLTMLMALKTLELRARRDAFVVFFLGFFLVLTQFLYSQSLLTALWTLATVWGLLAALILAQMPVGQPHLLLAARHAARNTLLGLPVMVALFMLFPRIAPLWGVPAESLGRTGLSNQMEFGAVAEMAEDDGIAMRLRFAAGAPLPPQQALYFRGPVLSRFDGKTWRARSSNDAFSLINDPSSAKPLVQGPALRYELTLEPLRLAVVPLLEMSPEAPGTEMPLGELVLRRSLDLQWQAPRAITERLRLQASAHLDYRAGPLRADLGLQAYLELPPNRNPRTLAWAAQLRRQPGFAALAEERLAPALAAAVLEHVRQESFAYTLAPGRYGELSPDLIDEFWFDRRLGFCEHFASAFVVVMRAMGVPARVVTGFQGADRELQDGYLVVRNSQAHAWAEYWVPGRGWLRADPTAAVAPERVNGGQVLRPQPGLIAGALGQVNPALWLQLRRGWETLNNRWQQAVLGYGRKDQFSLLKRLGFESPDWAALGQLGAAVVALLASVGGLWALWQARPHDAWSRQRAWTRRELRRLGVPAELHQGPRQWASLLEARHGPAAAGLAGQLLALEQARYGAASSARAGWLARWRQQREFRRAARSLRTLSNRKKPPFAPTS